MTRAVSTAGPLVGTQQQCVVAPRVQRNDQATILYLHGNGGTAFQCLDQDVLTLMAVDAGYTVIGLHNTSATNWGTDAAVADLHTVVTNVKAGGAQRVFLYAISGGAPLGMRYLQAHSSEIEGTILHLPGMDMEFLAVNANSPLTSADLLAAWGGQAAWDAVKETVNPIRYPEFFGVQRMQVHVSSDDDLFGTAPGFKQSIEDFCNEARIPIHWTGAVSHTDTGLDPDLVLPFLDS